MKSNEISYMRNKVTFSIPKALTITYIKLEIWIVLQFVLIYWQQFLKFYKFFQNFKFCLCGISSAYTWDEVFE
jgi:hypothetical protein